ncbi:unnamed protein product [Gadus morhua 'NCC']
MAFVLSHVFIQLKSMSVRSCHLKPDPSERASHSEETALLLNGAPDPIQECLDTHSPGPPAPPPLPLSQH